jgi:hypothetical protein
MEAIAILNWKSVKEEDQSIIEVAVKVKLISTSKNRLNPYIY